MTTQSRKELLASVRLRYSEATLKEKNELLRNLVASTGYNYKYAISLLNKPQQPDLKEKRKRTTKYDEPVSRALVQIWEFANCICARRLIPFLPTFLEILEKNGRLELERNTRDKLLQMSISTADRILERERKRRGVKNPALTKSGNPLRNHIQIRTFADWNNANPGFFEADTVGHHGGNVRGSFVHTLTLTDIATGWTELIALPRKTDTDVISAIEELSCRLPFPLLGIDTDNGVEFMNYKLVSWCEEREIACC